MKLVSPWRLFPLVLALCLCMSNRLLAAESDERFTNIQSSDSQSKIHSTFANLPLIFEPNHGQTDPSVLFVSRNSGFTLYLTSAEAIFVFPTRKKNEMADLQMSHLFAAQKNLSENKMPEVQQSEALRIKWKGAAAGMNARGLDRLPGQSNYFIGKDSSHWTRNVEHYGKVRLSGIYPGIDLVYYDHDRKLEFDWEIFAVSAGGSFCSATRLRGLLLLFHIRLLCPKMGTVLRRSEGAAMQLNQETISLHTTVPAGGSGEWRDLWIGGQAF